MLCRERKKRHILAVDTRVPILPSYVVTTNLFPQAGIVLWIGPSYAGALFLPRSGEPTMQL